MRFPTRSFSEASRKAATNHPYISQSSRRTTLLAAWNKGAGDFFDFVGRSKGCCPRTADAPQDLASRRLAADGGFGFDLGDQSGDEDSQSLRSTSS